MGKFNSNGPKVYHGGQRIISFGLIYFVVLASWSDPINRFTSIEEV